MISFKGNKNFTILSMGWTVLNIVACFAWYILMVSHSLFWFWTVTPMISSHLQVLLLQVPNLLGNHSLPVFTATSKSDITIECRGSFKCLLWEHIFVMCIRNCKTDMAFWSNRKLPICASHIKCWTYNWTVWCSVATFLSWFLYRGK